MYFIELESNLDPHDTEGDALYRMEAKIIYHQTQKKRMMDNPALTGMFLGHTGGKKRRKKEN